MVKSPAPNAKAAPANPRYRRKLSDNIAGYALMAPWLLGFFLMWLLPALVSMYYSLTDFNMLKAPKFIGLANYVRIFTNDPTFRKALAVTFAYVLILVPCRMAFALFVAVLLNKKHRGLSAYRALYYVPSIIGGSIAVSVVWKQIFGSKGVVMTLLGVFGIEQKMSVLGNPNYPHGRVAVRLRYAHLPGGPEADP